MHALSTKQRQNETLWQQFIKYNTQNDKAYYCRPHTHTQMEFQLIFQTRQIPANPNFSSSTLLIDSRQELARWFQIMCFTFKHTHTHCVGSLLTTDKFPSYVIVYSEKTSILQKQCRKPYVHSEAEQPHSHFVAFITMTEESHFSLLHRSHTHTYAYTRAFVVLALPKNSHSTIVWNHFSPRTHAVRTKKCRTNDGSLLSFNNWI